MDAQVDESGRCGHAAPYRAARGDETLKRMILALALLPTLANANDPDIDRCINLGDALDSPAVEGEWSYVIDDADIAMIANAGFDTIRLPVRFSTRWDGTRIDPVFQARVDHVVRTVLDHGMKVILDLHHFEDLMTDPNTHADSFVAIWAALGAHYAGWPDGLYFELLNEPAYEMTTQRVIPLYARIIAQLRADHPERWIIVEAGTWADRDEMFDLPDYGPFTAHSFHYYAPFDFTHQQLWWEEDPLPARDWDPTGERAAITADFAKVAAHQAPVFLGEFGTYRMIDTPSRLAWINAVRTASEAHDIGWCLWSFASNFGLVTEDKSAWLPGILDAAGLPPKN